MKPILVKAPAVLPVSLEELKQAARVDFADDNALLMTYLQSAVEHLDGYHGILGRAIINQDWRIWANEWPVGGIILPFGDVHQATIQYFDGDGLEQTLDAAFYELVEMATGAVIRFKAGFDAPQLDEDNYKSIKVTFTTGYGADAAAVPTPIKVAIMLLATHWYENREAVTGRNLTRLPFAVDRLITPYRRRIF